MSDDIVEWLIDFSEATNNPRCADAADKIIGISSANRRLRAENEKLREALRPFATANLKLYEDAHRKYVANDIWFEVGDLRAAAAAIRESGE